VKAKLLGLDYILENREFHYLPTKEEKVSFFTKVLTLDVDTSGFPSGKCLLTIRQVGWGWNTYPVKVK